MSGSFGDMGNILRQAQEMQRELDKAREALRKTSVEGTAGGGAVRVTVTGDRHVTSVEISAEIVAAADKGMLEDLLLAAVRDGLDQAAKLEKESLGRVTGGMDLPGLF